MKNKFQWFLVLIGTVLVVAGIFLGYFGADVLNIEFVRMDLVPVSVGFCGTIFLIMGTSAIASEKYKIKEQQIEENKERNMKINQSAKSKAFDLMTLLFSFGFLVLAMFGYMNKVSFLL